MSQRVTTKTFAIIGTGVTGTSALIALARQLRKHKEKNDTLPPIKIITVEKRHTNGPGYPYDPVGAHGAHLLNHPAAEMALKPVDERGKDKQADFEVAGWHSHDFVLWLKAHKSDILDKHPDSVKATQVDADPSVWTPRLDGHYSRGLFGLYAQDRFREAAAELRQLGVTVIQYTDTEVVAAQRQGHYLTLTLKDLQTGRLSKVKADKVLIATGRWTRQISSELKTTRWFEKPYPASHLLGAIKPDVLIHGRPKQIVVRGMGLSALDTILTLATGTFYRNKLGALRYRPGNAHAHIIAVSRSGYFPIVRGMPAVLPKLKYFTPKALSTIKECNDGYLTLDELRRLLEKELKEHLGQGFEMATYFLPKLTAEEKLREDLDKAKQGNTVYALCRQLLALQLFSQLRPEDKQYFTKNLRTLFLQNVAAMPIINAEKMLALFDAGVLSAMGLGYAGAHITVEGERVRLDYSDASGNALHTYADYVIQASGDDLDISNNTDPFIRCLIDQGEIVSDVAGGIKVNLRTYAVLGQAAKGGTRDSSILYALGMPVMNWAAERDFASASIKAAHVVASEWSSSLEP